MRDNIPDIESKEDRIAREDARILADYRGVGEREILALIRLYDRTMGYKFVAGFKEGLVKQKHRKDGFVSCKQTIVILIWDAMREALGYENKGLTERAQSEQALHECWRLHDAWARRDGKEPKYGY